MRSLFIIFIFTSFISGLLAEGRITNFSHDEEMAQSSEVVSGEDYHCENCHDHERAESDESDCHDQAGHCGHHCAGLHNILLISSYYHVDQNVISFCEQRWFYKVIYEDPVLEPSLKPPLTILS